METTCKMNLSSFAQGLAHLPLRFARLRSRWTQAEPYRSSRKHVSPLQAVYYGLVVLTLVGTWPQPVLAQLSCTVTQITPFTDVIGGTSINAAGTLIAFTSDADLTGGNPDRSQEIFLFDTTTNTFRQITDTIGGGPGGTISADGTRIAFVDTTDLTGGNPDGNQEVFLVDIATQTFTQITSSTQGEAFGPSLNADGTRIAIQTSADLTGGNPDGSREIFLFDTTTSTLTQITSSTGPSVDPAINGDGTRIAFQSFADLTGGNPDGNYEIFLFDTTTNTLTQITNTSGRFNIQAAINADGTRIAFTSTANLTGGNPDGSEEIFLFDTSASTFLQITSNLGTVTEFPAINADGTRIAFTSNGGGGVFLFDTTTNTLTQVDSVQIGGLPAINADGSRIAFARNGAIFLAVCKPPGDIWASKTDMPTARFGHGVAAATSSNLYAIGGQGGGGYLARVEEYDPTTDTWTAKERMPTARRWLGVAAAGNGKLYAIGGQVGNFGVWTVEEYDPLTDSWTPKARMNRARFGLGVDEAGNGKIYAIGGTLNGPVLNVVEEYDPLTNKWKTRKAMPTARAWLGVAAASNSKLYAIGGVVNNVNNPTYVRTVEEYDPATNAWTTKAPMPTARAGLGVVAASNGKIYAIGGTNGGTNFNRVEECDPATDTWTTKAPMPTARRFLGVAAAPNGKLYAIGGRNAGVVLATVEEYQPPE